MEIDANLIFGLSGERIGVVFLTLWLIVAAISLKQRWDSNSWKIFWIALGLLCLASSVTALYWHFFAPSAENGCIADDECNLANDYNLHRNLAILFFGIFAGGLAIWSRFHNEKQIEISLDNNRNDLFAKAVEMLGTSELTSQSGALYIMKDLIDESPETEYTRCNEVLGHWSKKGVPPELKDRLADIIVG